VITWTTIEQMRYTLKKKKRRKKTKEKSIESFFCFIFTCKRNQSEIVSFINSK
jgi:hypothetical protein